MAAAGVPTAATLSVARAAVRRQGRRARGGQGRLRLPDRARSSTPRCRAVEALGGAVVIEELLEGHEVSLFALCDGRRAVPLGAAQDFKRLGDGDVGPNTGGMGAYSPVPSLDDAAALVEQIHQPVLEELARRGAPFVGCLFAGLMLTADGPRVLEFNARFGDPETQVLMPRVDGRPARGARRRGGRRSRRRRRRAATIDAAVTVVLAGPDYPRAQRLRRRGRSPGIDEAAGGRRARLPRRHGGAGRARSSRTAAESSP